MKKRETQTPALVAHHDKLLGNIDEMAKRVQKTNLAIPLPIQHHDTPFIVHMQRKARAIGRPHVKLGESKVMASVGFEDISNAYPNVE